MYGKGEHLIPCNIYHSNECIFRELFRKILQLLRPNVHMGFSRSTKKGVPCDTSSLLESTNAAAYVPTDGSHNWPRDCLSCDHYLDISDNRVGRHG